MEEFFSKLFTEDGAVVFSKCLIVAITIIALFIVAREIVTWYYKINKIVALLESIDSKLSVTMQPKNYNYQQVNSMNYNNPPAYNPIPQQNQYTGQAIVQTDNVNLTTENKIYNIESNSQVHNETKVTFAEKVKGILTKEFHISDLFSNKKNHS